MSLRRAKKIISLNLPLRVTVDYLSILFLKGMECFDSSDPEIQQVLRVSKRVEATNRLKALSDHNLLIRTPVRESKRGRPYYEYILMKI